MADRVANQRKPKAGSREDKPLSFPAAVYLDRIFATPDERAALDAASAALDKAAEALAALVSPETFKAKLVDLARGRAGRGRPRKASKKRGLVRALIEATGDVERTGSEANGANRAVAECAASAMGRASDVAANIAMAQDVRRELLEEYKSLSTRGAALRTAFAVAALETLDWSEREKKAIEIFLASFGAFDVAIEKSPGAPRRREKRD